MDALSSDVRQIVTFVSDPLTMPPSATYYLPLKPALYNGTTNTRQNYSANMQTTKTLCPASDLQKGGSRHSQCAVHCGPHARVLTSRLQPRFHIKGSIPSLASTNQIWGVYRLPVPAVMTRVGAGNLNWSVSERVWAQPRYGLGQSHQD